MPDTSALNIPHSPVAALGTLTVLIAFLVAAFATSAGIYGTLTKRRRLVDSSVLALYGFSALMLLASALLIFAFITHDYTIKYVWAYSDSSMPLYYKITAYWGGLDGSLMFWVSVLAVFSTIAVRSNAERHRDMIGYVVATIMLIQLFFLALIVYNKNPFATYLTDVPLDGKGLNPLLQNYWMVIHPPSLYIGYVAATIPFAFGVAALASGRLDDLWLKSVRTWTLICWFFLSFGLILGGRWAYEELGWGGYWAWDPVENAGLLPWFTATAFLHSVIVQEQRGMMKVWNLVLVITTFFLTIFGTFMTRSGVVQSVHAFGEDNALALLFILFMGAILIVSFGLVLYRLPALRARTSFESRLSREYAFLLNNWILLGSALFVLFATMFPTLSEAVNGQRITVGPPFFNKWMIPTGLVLLLLAGAAPLLAYRRTTAKRLWNQFAFPVGAMVVVIAGLAIFFPRTRVMTEVFIGSGRKFANVSMPMSLINFGIVAFVFGSIGQEFFRGTKVRVKQTAGSIGTSLIGLILSKRRKYGGYIIHLGVALMFIGFAGKAYESMEDFTVRQGDSFALRGYTFYYHDLRTTDDANKRADTATVQLYEGKVEIDASKPLPARVVVGDYLGDLVPARYTYKKSDDQPTTEVDLMNYVAEDVYLILTGFNSDTRVANFRVYINPLINWVWFGFFVLALGTMICLIPTAWVDALKPARTRKGKATEVAIMLLVGAAITFGMIRSASAQGSEYNDGPKHEVGVSAAHMFRPNDPQIVGPYRDAAAANVKAANPTLAAGSPEFKQAVAAELEPITSLASKLMRDLVCLCGGCSRETVLECRCGFAAGEREKVVKLLTQYDLSTEPERVKAYDDIVATFVEAHDGAHVLQHPPDNGFNRLAWMVPVGGLLGALGLLIGFGRRWVRRQSVIDEKGSIKLSADEQDAYDELLDDELSDLD